MKEDLNKQRKTIAKLLTEKSVMKQTVYANTIKVFEMLNDEAKNISEQLTDQIKDIDKRVTFDFKLFNLQSFQLKVAGDMLQFDMYTNVFQFEKSHPIHKTSYAKTNEFNTYCGIISVYNFLADSFKFNRLNDAGFLVARIFINHEFKFFIETKTNLKFKYTNYSEVPITNDHIKDIINELIIYSIEFDLNVPHYNHVNIISVAEIQEKASSQVLKTGKRLGYIGGNFSPENQFDSDFNL